MCRICDESRAFFLQIPGIDRATATMDTNQRIKARVVRRFSAPRSASSTPGSIRRRPANGCSQRRAERRSSPRSTRGQEAGSISFERHSARTSSTSANISNWFDRAGSSCAVGREIFVGFRPCDSRDPTARGRLQLSLVHETMPGSVREASRDWIAALEGLAATLNESETMPREFAPPTGRKRFVERSR